ncbi:MAG: zinc ABC transporter substrate-binding protein [Gammaproteobacteria bacterium]|nr:zinc ABC transporter substrate-binding protein [Gammaproteobacteria bacterium]MDH3820566.1 zinc ABC transporter substrate-binding protein [Gammaproteobacteria bacterium]MDH3983085.1 zinc ABC transporter substrate-binding protein [Gammaproteobacteria bacterium]
MRRFMLTLLFLMASVTASAELEIFACEPEWAALADEIGGDLVTSYSATTALQDPHYIQARPSLIAKVRKADLVICSGAQLEIGWLPALLQKANNRKVLPGNDGYMEASSYVIRLDATANLDRARGDIHPQGNPHIQTDPHNISAVARALSERLVKIDSVNSEAYETNLEQFLIRWEQAVSRWEDRAEPLRGKRAITHHKSWVYLLRWLGIEEVEHLEAIPGLPPTATHLGKLTAEFGSGGADVIIRSPYQHAKPSEWLAERTGIPAIILPLTVGGTEGATDLFALFDDIVGRLIEVVGDA